MADTIDFPEYAPDLSTLGTGTSQLVSGALPRADGYGPFKSFEALTQSMPAACRGMFFARRSDNSIAIFGGTATKLYLLNNSTYVWDDVSQSGPYSTLTDADNWQFVQFNDLVIAVQQNVAPQKYTLAGGGVFADLGGSPPQAGHIALVNRIVVLTGLLSNPSRTQWSDLDDPEQWVAGVGLSDYQDFPDGGRVDGVSGGDLWGLIFQEGPIRSMVYAPGSATTFQITKISENDPLDYQYGVIQAGDMTFFHTAQGFKMVASGGKPVPIGKERVDRFFAGDVDNGLSRIMIAAADPTATRVYWAYKSKAGAAGLFDKVLVYDWSIGKAGRWAMLPISGEYLVALAAPGKTLEQLDAVAPTPISITGAANNGGGLIRLTVSATSNAYFNIAGQNFIVVQGVTGTTEANGTWRVTIINSTHIDLIGSAFTNAYISGGQIGGSLDALPFSLDSVSTASIAALAAVNSSHVVGFFNGVTMEAILETDEQDGKGTVLFVDSALPITDCGDVLVSMGGRQTAQAAVGYTAESPLEVTGWCSVMMEARYLRARARFPAGSNWTYARGVQPSAQGAGER